MATTLRAIAGMPMIDSLAAALRQISPSAFLRLSPSSCTNARILASPTTTSSYAHQTHAATKKSRTVYSLAPRQFEAAAAECDREVVSVLGIETSCDDTCAAVVTADGRILGEAQVSQANMLVHYGGVVPMLAQELHAQSIDQVVEEALANARMLQTDLSAIAVTIGPGISPCLRVGVTKARSIARVNRLPLIGVHHMEAHALVARLMEHKLHFPFIVLLISGGHNLLLVAQNVGQYVQLGTTVDDAIGEAFDKTARLLGLDLRKGGGPALEEIALQGNPTSFPFAVPMRNQKHCNFSYAGLKNQVRLAIESQKINENAPMSLASAEDRQMRADIAASFQRVAILHLEDRCRRAIDWARKIDPTVSCLVVSGGVASNNVVRTKLGAVTKEHGLQLICPPPRLCTDNGVMVAWAGIEHLRLGIFDPPPHLDEPADAWELVFITVR
ncbi:hypothetical protein O6H91_04G020700 [Diphasiastrum complanatum]|uniref:Uncharacterized protein n=1 Tax=Diphasiastrum complanatum TaxID=34168 RepID=A0ACC2DUT0_DIPCM|nr:hypothetical protein O6H91_04G020700 [Diphasiastrum complanatum]